MRVSLVSRSRSLVWAGTLLYLYGHNSSSRLTICSAEEQGPWPTAANAAMRTFATSPSESGRMRALGRASVGLVVANVARARGPPTDKQHGLSRHAYEWPHYLFRTRGTLLEGTTCFTIDENPLAQQCEKRDNDCDVTRKSTIYTFFSQACDSVYISFHA
jgi:hypothetical protein